MYVCRCVCMYVEVYVCMHKDRHEHMRGCKDVRKVYTYECLLRLNVCMLVCR
ncbi:hypothetical protein Hdeb2414_s0025g00664691 [Helianthus debilis subsp. tardiflorus]